MSYTAPSQALNSLYQQERQILTFIKAAQHEHDFLTSAIKIYLQKKYAEITLALKEFLEFQKFSEISHPSLISSGDVISPFF